MRYGLIALALMLPLPVQAAEFIKIDRSACETLIRHHPAPDVAYQPGVDAYGRPVAPADLNPSIELPPVITIPVTVDIAKQFNLPLGAAKGTEATVGVIRLDGDKAYFNGQPLQPEDEENLAVLCLEANPGSKPNNR